MSPQPACCWVQAGSFHALIPVSGVSCFSLMAPHPEQPKRFLATAASGAGPGTDTGLPLDRSGRRSRRTRQCRRFRHPCSFAPAAPRSCPASFVGRRWSHDLLKELPAGVDPCGENGEIHTIVVGGPMFEKRIKVEVGEVVQRNGFAYADASTSMSLAARPARSDLFRLRPSPIDAIAKESRQEGRQCVAERLAGY